MLRKYELRLSEQFLSLYVFELLDDIPTCEKLLFYPDRHGFGKAHHPLRSIAMIRLKQALKFQYRFVVKDNRTQLRRHEGVLGEHPPNRIARKGLVVLFAAKALFLRCGNNVTIHQ